MVFEQAFEVWQNEQKKRAFIQAVKDYDDKIYDSMKRQGWESNGFKERTISFIWGTVTFKRRCYIRDGSYCVPVDEHFGFRKGQRVSRELLIKIAKLAIEGTYASACRIIWELCHLDISVWTVHHAVSCAADLLEEREEYRYVEEQKVTKKLEVKKLCIEGDGVMFRTRHPKEEKKYWSDYAHFVVHTGVAEKKKGRPECQNRMEFFGYDLEKVRAQLIDHIHNTMTLTDETVVITNSDGGKGYTPKAFRDLVRELGVKHHEHFWDKYHVKEKIMTATKNFPEIGEVMLSAIYAYDREKMKTALTTLQANLDNPEDEDFLKFQKKILLNFKWTKPAKLRGLESSGIGVMESNHRKITYRAKRRGMHWSKKNMTAIGRLIILREAHLLDELFYGNWRDMYERYHEVDASGWYRLIEAEYEPPQGKLWGKFRI